MLGVWEEMWLFRAARSVVDYRKIGIGDAFVEI